MMNRPESTPYSEGFFANISGASRRSAQQTVPLVMSLIQCGSVVDVGCGVGSWLRVFKEQGVTEVLGLDGDYVKTGQLEINAAEFRAVNLASPPKLEREFDLAVSLEVAEHLPPDAADPFVAYLAQLAPVVMFSAAVPGQGGTNHLNEQWPDYWAGLFEKHNFATLDCLREQLWHNEQVEWYYVQNMLLFVRNEFLASHPELQALAARTQMNRLSLVHPRTFAIARREVRELQQKLLPENMPLKDTIRALPAIFRGALKRRAGR